MKSSLQTHFILDKAGLVRGRRQAQTCLTWDADVGLRWSRLLVDLRAKGRSMPIKDSLIAATALAHDLVVVTRNCHSKPTRLQQSRRAGCRPFLLK